MSRVQGLIEQHGILPLPGIFDTLSARIAERVGYRMAIVSGYSVAATTIGEPDMGLLTQTELVDRARRICGSVSIPILVDADTGYGNPLNVFRTVKELIGCGAAGCFLEDQVWPKRCGHMRGKQVIAADAYQQKILAAVEARGDHDFFIVARTDALAIEGIESALQRVTLARKAGANASFIEAPDSIETLRAIGKRAPGPNVANMIEGGRTPLLEQQELADLGFQLVLHPLTGLYASARIMEQVFAHLLHQGSSRGLEDRMMDFAEFNALVGLEAKYAMEARFASNHRTQT